MALLIGVAIVAFAGIKRDGILAAEGKQIQGIQSGSAFRIGLIIAITCGVLSGLLNVGFSATEPIGAVAEKAGAVGSAALSDMCPVVIPDAVLRWYRKLVAAKDDGSHRRPGHWSDVVDSSLHSGESSLRERSSARSPVCVRWRHAHSSSAMACPSECGSASWASVLVLSGVTRSLEEVPFDQAPDIVVGSLAELAGLLKPD